jgi:hypothetical protein
MFGLGPATRKDHGVRTKGCIGKLHAAVDLVELDMNTYVAKKKSQKSFSKWDRMPVVRNLVCREIWVVAPDKWKDLVSKPFGSLLCQDSILAFVCNSDKWGEVTRMVSQPLWNQPILCMWTNMCINNLLGRESRS